MKLFSPVIIGSLTGSEGVINPFTASWAVTASVALNVVNNDASRILQGAVTASVSSGSVIFLIQSASQDVVSISSEGLFTLSGSASTLFLIKNANGNSIVEVSQSGVVVLATQSVELSNPAPNGGIYFTSSSFFVGLD